MSRVAKFGLTAVVGAFLIGVLASPARQAEARPNYCKIVIEHYKDVPAMAEAKCGICHPGKDKKERNNYGMALGKALGAPKQMDAAKIMEAIKKVEGEPSAVEGKTFGDLLKEGKLPGSK
ncbi:MAG: hypothetical protein R3C99_20290 [Pirellulaceae bacterium]|nr:hypothetical protein [Planctomycetales bacterium]MCA9165770.1 hypothetical protein [Planctomycetales bacterium]MCA9210991.1 hypothetical protein [Planctomycetales bacterium]MCA9218889.1 hypothetical protein [Planctomycetales bacterium]MCA9228507.1 hypothetical protein [Planctomycetales bacterium]